jgi:hypothetical protein
MRNMMVIGASTDVKVRPMPPRTDEAVASTNERDFRFVAKLVVAPDDFGLLRDEIEDWHLARGLKQHHGRRERIDDCEIASWCFADTHTAMTFHKQFGGALQINPCQAT